MQRGHGGMLPLLADGPVRQHREGSTPHLCGLLASTTAFFGPLRTEGVDPAPPHLTASPKVDTLSKGVGKYAEVMRW